MTGEGRKRSLLLAGGGMKVAHQAGALQVLLDEAGLEFDHIDACSGGAFNLAMLCQGMSGTQVADAWRKTRPLDGVSRRPWGLLLFPFGGSLTDLRRYPEHVYPTWVLDEATVRTHPRDFTATFTAWDIEQRELTTFSQSDFSFEVLRACISMPMWFPPVRLGSGTYTDAVFATDANVQAALDNGADEIWILWTVSERREFLPGGMAQFFHALETSANERLRIDLERIEENNRLRRAGGPCPLGREVTVHVVKAEVPVQYLLVLGADRLHRAVERGVEDVRRYCRARGVPLPGRSSPAVSDEDAVSIRFPDEMGGQLVRTPVRRGEPAVTVAVDARFDMVVEDVGRFVADPEHHARIDGTVYSDLFDGGSARVVGGGARILLDADHDELDQEVHDPTVKAMRYRLLLRGRNGREDGTLYTLDLSKNIGPGGLRALWTETTVSTVWVWRGHHAPGTVAPADEMIANGHLAISRKAVARQVLAPRVTHPDRRSRARARLRFGAAFVGELWDAYLRRFTGYGPF